MVRHIASDFLKDKRQYHQAERYWRELWDRLVGETGVAEQWSTPWLGAPLRDGDPMFSAVAPALRRGVHVIQHEPTSEALYPQNALTLAQSLTAYTAGTARVNHHDHVTGDLRTGYHADLVVLDRDPFAAPAEEIAQARVTRTYVGGELVFHADS